MKGTRPLDNNEIRLVSVCFDGIFEARNRGLFMIGASTGGHISELLSLQIGDVYQNGRAVTDLLFDKSIVKGGEVSRAVPVNRDGQRAIEALIAWHRERYPDAKKSRLLFPSRNGQGAKRMSRRTAHDVLKITFEAAGLNGHLATHSLRKSFTQRLYDKTGDIFAVQEMLGHKSVATIQEYLGVNYASIKEAVEAMAVGGELHISGLLGSTTKKEKDETLFLELVLRGYDKFTPEFKAEVVLEVLSGATSQAEVCRHHNLNENQLSQWKRQLLENAPMLFDSTDKQSSEVSEKRIAHLEQLVERMETIALDIQKNY